MADQCKTTLHCTRPTTRHLPIRRYLPQQILQAFQIIYYFRVLVLIGIYLTITTAQQLCVCTQEKKEVCGSDGNTYDNLCLLRCEQATKPSLTLRGEGRCREVTPGCFCADDNVPLCATDGEIYSNECELNCQQAINPQLRICNKDICCKGTQVTGDNSLINDMDIIKKRFHRTVKHSYGTVKHSYGTVKQSYGTVKHSEIPRSGSTVPVRVTVPIPCDCPSYLVMTCGTDGVIYDNECLLHCASKNKPDLRVQNLEICTNINSSMEAEEQGTTTRQ